MRLTHVCLVSPDVPRLRDFYRGLLRCEPLHEEPGYVEFAVGPATLALLVGSSRPAGNRSAILEFEVDDVDREYERLLPLVSQWVEAPATQPWGNRSVQLRDPDGNLIDLYSRVAVPA